MMRQKLKVLGRGTVLILMAVLLVAGDPSTTALAAPATEGDTTNKGNSTYYTHNGIIFYDGGKLYCSSGASVVGVSGGAAGMLAKQTSLDKEWIPIILNSASRAGADPIAMTSLLFWENRGLPKIDSQWGGSDAIGRGPWQITSGTWPQSAGPYASGVIDPKVATPVAANLVKNWGGQAGIPIGSIDQDFGKGKNIPSMATVAKNYNAGRYTWREPGVAGYKAGGRVWRDQSGPWFAQKQEIIDDYILAMTYAYFLIATGEPLPSKGGFNNDAFVQKAQQNAQRMKDFKITDGSNTANTCAENSTSEGNGSVADTARKLAWPNRKYTMQDRKSAATPLFQKVMPEVHGGDPGNSAWSDCGVFVATAVRHSGADPKYALRGTGVQLAYVKRNKDKYDVFTNFTNTSQLKPGDIFIIDVGYSGHTFIHTGKYKGDDGREYEAASASWTQDTPMASPTYLSDDRGRYTVARLKTVNPAPQTVTGGQ